MAQRAARQRLRALLSRPEPVVTLGVHDVFSALLAEQAGIEMLFLGGFGTAASLLGLPDLNLLTSTEMADAVRRTTARVGIPVIADGDTGHGGAPQVERTVRLLEAAGASGVILEDQVFPKRCGHFADKQVVPWDEMARRLRIALASREDPDLVLVARTDARATAGLDEAIDRANRAGELGADVVFIEAPQSRAELEQIARRVRYPLLVNMLTGGQTPILPAAELGALGYRIVVAPIESLLVCATALQHLLAELRRCGRVDHLAAAGMMSFGTVTEVLDLPHYLTAADERERR
ncbi:MAG: isocitrate lyase/PEP mutase family protein [Fimbriimonadaceae bacterium]|nr:isocitrate lyase/PEP mutase family protein [Fimbriimonadaceae bacterium]